MRYLVLFIVFLSTYLQSFSQNTDSVPKKKFESFFGCDCCTDTVVINAGPGWKYTCTLYKSGHLLSMSKNGKVVWKRDLKEFFEGKNPDGFCVNGFGEKWNDYIIVENGSKTRAVFHVKTGRKVKTLKKTTEL
ncbi:hypothetical protein D3C87_32900 [compost metagenome]